MPRKKILWIWVILLLVFGLGYYWMYQPVSTPTVKEINRTESVPLPADKPMIETRAAIDIGSGASNLKIAKVDVATQKIVEQLYEKSIPVSYQKFLEQSPDGTFNQEIMTQGLAAMHTFKKIADEYHVKKVVAVATAAFRQAKNGLDLTKEIEAQTGIPVFIIDQNLEGILAFEASMANTDLKPDQTVVWDIGGGSVQFTTKTPQGEFVIQKGVLASIPFRNALIQKIQNKTQDITTPNPVAEQEVKQAMELIGAETIQTDPYILNKLSEPSTKVLGVGSMFNYGIKTLVGTSEVTQENLEKGIYSRLGKTDSELNLGQFSDIGVSDPLLILGYMKGMNIDKVDVLQVNNADGAMIYPAFWTA